MHAQDAGGSGGHQGETDPAALHYGQNMDGSENRDVVVIPCPEPGCGSVSYWPREVFPPEVQAKLP